MESSRKAAKAPPSRTEREKGRAPASSLTKAGVPKIFFPPPQKKKKKKKKKAPKGGRPTYFCMMIIVLRAESPIGADHLN